MRALIVSALARMPVSAFRGGPEDRDNALADELTAVLGSAFDKALRAEIQNQLERLQDAVGRVKTAVTELEEETDMI